jgi:Rod binding domain-containing protein
LRADQAVGLAEMIVGQLRQAPLEHRFGIAALDPQHAAVGGHPQVATLVIDHG